MDTQTQTNGERGPALETTAAESGSAASAGSANRGWWWRRTADNPAEKAFADAWEKECAPSPWLNYGQGILQDLFMRPGRFGRAGGGDVVRTITDGERMVAATAVQWLGSNCGFCFLESVLKKCGWRLVRIKEGDSQNDQDQAPQGSGA